MAEHCPLKRCATPDDVARVVGFLASEDGGWVNGKAIIQCRVCFLKLTNACRTSHHYLWWFFAVDHIVRNYQGSVQMYLILPCLLLSPPTGRSMFPLSQQCTLALSTGKSL